MGSYSLVIIQKMLILFCKLYVNYNDVVYVEYIMYIYVYN